MQIHITVHLENYVRRLLMVTVDAQAQPGDHIFLLHVLTVGNGVSIVDWQVTGGQSRVDESQVHINGSSFRVQYSVAILHELCLGAAVEVEFTYPFLNTNEIFFGSGILPIPQEPYEVTFQLSGLPDGWSEFSSLTPGGIHPSKLPEFFCYCATDLEPITHLYHGRLQDIELRLLTQRGKSLPMPAQALFAFFDKYMNWLEHSLLPYQRANEINFLILQAPPNFATLANSRTFATGENTLNGIVCYAPSDVEYLQKYLGYTSYAQFLYEGLAHELLHYYTTASLTGRKKSVLYPSPECPPYAIKLLADALNIYFYSQYVSEHIPEARGSFEMWVSRARSRQQKTGKRQPLLDLQLLDEHLQANGSSLLVLFREMVRLKLHNRQPYKSAKFLFDTMHSQLHIPPITAIENEIILQE